MNLYSKHIFVYNKTHRLCNPRGHFCDIGAQQRNEGGLPSMRKTFRQVAEPSSEIVVTLNMGKKPSIQFMNDVVDLLTCSGVDVVPALV